MLFFDCAIRFFRTAQRCVRRWAFLFSDARISDGGFDGFQEQTRHPVF
jgi:hypothetical protein